VAIIVSAMHRPVPPAAPPVATVDVAKLQVDFSRQLNDAVSKAVAESDARHTQVLSAAEKRFDAVRRADMEKISQSFAYMQKIAALEHRAAYFPDGSR
jgi:hypothetical protein